MSHSHGEIEGESLLISGSLSHFIKCISQFW